MKDLRKSDGNKRATILLEGRGIKLEKLVFESLKVFAGAFSVSGQYDLVAIARVANNDELATLVTTKMRAIQSIQKTETMLAFRTYSRHDLEAMFSVGM